VHAEGTVSVRTYTSAGGGWRSNNDPLHDALYAAVIKPVASVLVRTEFGGDITMLWLYWSPGSLLHEGCTESLLSDLAETVGTHKNLQHVQVALSRHGGQKRLGYRGP